MSTTPASSTSATLSDTVGDLVARPAPTKAPIRGHRPSIMNSLDLSEESRDTVSLKDSEQWYPQFSPAATLPQAKKLQQEKQTGLNALLANRMTKNAFESRFLGGADLAELRVNHQSPATARLQQEEASGESLFNRSAKLGALLANRPDKARLESMNIMKAPQGAGSSNAFAGMQAKLEASKKKDKLNSLLSARPDQEALKKRGVLIDETAASSSQLPRDRLASAKNALGDFFAARPNPELLVKQKIITDIGDLPGGLERKQENQLTPERVTANGLDSKKVVNVSLGFSHTMALTEDGVVFVFGGGANGRLGVTEGSLSDLLQPTPIPASHFGGEAVALIDAGENHSAAVTKSGKLFTWGTGAWGRLGLGNQDDQSIPRQVALPEGELALGVSCGAYHTLVLTVSKKLYAFGWNKNGRCGLGRKHPSLLVLTPVEVAFFSDPSRTIKSFEAGQGYSYALTSQGETYLWGTGSFGGLGFGEEQDVWEPTLLNVPHTLELVALGGTHTLGTSAKGLYSWGANDKGQLGRTDTEIHSPSSPVAASASSSTSSSSHSFAHHSSTPSKSFFVPGLVQSATPFLSGLSIAAGKAHSFYVSKEGKLYGFGLGSRGILGLGDEHDNHTPTEVTAFSSTPIKQVDASWTHSAAVTQAGQLFTWGAKNNGRLGY